jgi:hypothetical protein
MYTRAIWELQEKVQKHFNESFGDHDWDKCKLCYASKKFDEWVNALKEIEK